MITRRGPSATAPDERWIRRLHPQRTCVWRLLCFPHAGGSASYYRALGDALSPEIDVLAVQYPGRQDRRSERCLTSIAELADGVHDAVAALGDRPCAFFGHSMGATVAFEVAHRLEQRDGPMPHLYVSASRAPSCRRPPTALHRLGDADLVAELLRLGGTDPRALDDPDLLALILSATRADYRAIETYACTPAPALSCPITAFAGDHDPLCATAEAAAWASHTTAGFRLHVYHGGHFYLDHHVQEIAQVLVSSAAGIADQR